MSPARNLLTAALILLLPSVALPAPSSAQRTYEVSLTRGSRLLVQARVNGHAVEALLDSAAEATLIDRKFAKTLGLASATTVNGQGSGGSSFDAGLVNGVRLQVFGVSLENQTVAVTDLQDVGQRLLGRRIDVILGREIFDAARLQIDVEGRRITVLPPEADPAGIRLELTTEHGVETIPVSVEQAGTVRATFDLGNGSQVLVGKQLVERLHLLSDGHAVSASRGGGLGGETERQVIVLRSLEVAGRRFENVPAAIDSQPSASDLNVGIDILRHFVITTDFAAHTVWLQPRRDRPAH
jgi:predicted aspartyl protease